MTVHRSSGQFLPTLANTAGNVFAPIQREFDRLFDHLGNGWATMVEAELSPKMDIRDTKDGIEITLELPGIDQDDVKIAVEDDMLTVSGEKKTRKDTREEDFRVCERSYGAFSRSIGLPRSANAAKIKASMKNGVLRLTVPRDRASQTKTIEIQPAP